MSSIHHLQQDIAVVGWACRLPGARSISEFWSLLLEGRCAVSQVPDDRFSLMRFGHPRRQERGKSYSWAAGIVDDLWAFDPTVFGISPREAEQMDPQQRILLQLTWEAFEDAGIRPSLMANSEVGVFVGASQTDYGHAFFGDQAIADAHFATGTALAILANRISYIFDLRGPSVTIDTACSSSLVALHQAMAALRSGRCDTAIVAGSNVIASPASFIAFSQANMLSPTGLCRAFSASADGFVRAEGAIVLILRKKPVAVANKNPIHGYVVATDVNSDGRTSGISLPSPAAQEDLLRRIYARGGMDLDRVAFVEAHGTGTAVGDPVEATAIGQAVATQRGRVLPIGSVKTNIGHLEPASGLAGVLKALLALNHGILPPSLHFDEPNPRIDFRRLNIAVCDQALLLPDAGNSIAGVNSFGFGGTNAHAVVAGGLPVSPSRLSTAANGSLFMLSAESDEALTGLAQNYAERFATGSDSDAAITAACVLHRREHLSKRLVIANSTASRITAALAAFMEGSTDPDLQTGTASGKNLPVAFVYSGNGGQWAGMGIAAYQNNACFRSQFDKIDLQFSELADWSLKEKLFSKTLDEELTFTSVAQPLIFAIQSAATAALLDAGLVPATAFGHSLGEVAAAEAAGILTTASAVDLVFKRSRFQELVRGQGRMVAVLASVETAQELAKHAGDIDIAAINSPRSVTIAGPPAALTAFKTLAQDRGTAVLDLDLEYPFHSKLMDSIRQKLVAGLRTIVPGEGGLPFVSSVTGEMLAGSRLNASYWWRNVREPVQFADAVRCAAKLGARYFVEIGPRGMLGKHIGDALQGEVSDFCAVSVLERNEQGDPFRKTLAKALVGGAQLDIEKLVGPDPGPGISLPSYPWHQQQLRFSSTVEAIGAETRFHALAGARVSADSLEWRSHIDPVHYHHLLDHKIGDQVIFPGSGFVEIALAVARQLFPSDSVGIADLEIMSALDLTNGASREVMTRVSAGSNICEIFSRPRLSKVAWLLHCRCKLSAGPRSELPTRPVLAEVGEIKSRDIYEIADVSGLHYGPAFRLLERVAVHSDAFYTVELRESTADISTDYELDPMRFDCSGHGLFAVFPELHYRERGVTYIPVRLDEVVLHRPGGIPTRALLQVLGKSDQSITANFDFYDCNDLLIASVRKVRSQAISTRRALRLESAALVETPELVDGALLSRTGIGPTVPAIAARARKLGIISKPDQPSPCALLLDGWAAAVAYEIASGLATNRVVDLNALVTSERLPVDLRLWFFNILLNLESAGLARQDGDCWNLLSDPSLPTSAAIIRAIAEEQPSRAAELLIAGAISGFARRVMAEGAITAGTEVLPRAAASLYRQGGVEFQNTGEFLERGILARPDLWPKDRALRVLQIGGGSFVDKLTQRNPDRHVMLTTIDPDDFEDVEGPSHGSDRADERLPELGFFDLIVVVDSLHRLPRRLSLSDLQRGLAPNGLLVATAPKPSFFRDIAFGHQAGWFSASGSAQRPASPLLTGADWQSALERAGFKHSESYEMGGEADHAILIVAKLAPSSAAGQVDARPVAGSMVVLASKSSRALATSICKLAGLRGLNSSIQSRLAISDPATPQTVVLLPNFSAKVDALDTLTVRCMAIKECAERLGPAPATLWLVFSQALAVGSGPVCPTETGAWAFSRALANEFKHLDIRRLDLGKGVPLDAASEVLASAILSGTAETELHFDGTSIRAVRITNIGAGNFVNSTSRKTANKLERRSAGRDRVSWQPTNRQRPRAEEVEIRVEASGLNFRDVMWSLSLLPADILEDGFTGATLGIECAGRISRVGHSVSGLRVGDRVMSFAPNALANYVVVPALHAVKLPDQLSCDAAATVPVAFLTAHYSLVTVAKLKRGEWVLIHGAAGGVGMAAIQIALLRKARIIATTGSAAKRDLLRALGVEYVFDSRSADFGEQVRVASNGGVDVVLNSLAGDAMEQSIGCLRPFGRFIELGKRDYVANTHVGLRPFRKNLSYFGVDVDQLISSHQDLGLRIYRKLMDQFKAGALRPLPYSSFNADDVGQAFHLMQQSTHIGKLIVRPPSATRLQQFAKPLRIRETGTHVVTGAFGGLGFEVVKWLVQKGVRHLVLIGRRGSSAEADQFLRDAGVTAICHPCDVSDEAALKKVFAKAKATMPPVVGVIHAAMVLDDATIANLTAERFQAVFAPKVRGASNLDRLTRRLNLDYFILFSSISTLFGNPGQGNYVAANAYMEGLVRQRRMDGLPGLAIAWGPISDVGAVARSKTLQAGLEKLTGVRAMHSSEALRLMDEIMSAPPIDSPVLTLSAHNGTFAAGRLPVLSSPTYAGFVSHDFAPGEKADVIDLHALAEAEGAEAVRRVAADAIVAQLARVLHARHDDISRVRPLGEIGLDSLMGLELLMNLEQVFGLPLAVSGSSSAKSVGELADEITASVIDENRVEEASIVTFAEQHQHHASEARQIEALKDMASAQNPVKRVLS